MKTPISPLELVRPESFEHALRLFAGTPSLTPIAGCTDVYVGLNFGTLKAQSFIDLWGLPELVGIEVVDDVLRFGGLTTHSELVASAEVQEWLPMLAAACREIGGVQIQNRGTLAGNIANGSPAGDTLPVLAVAEAVLVLAHQDGERRVPFNEFYTGYRATVLRPGELIRAIEVPRVDGKQWFRKVGTRAAQAISKIVIAGVRGPQPRIAVGSVAPTVVRLRQTETALAAGASDDDVVAAMMAEIKPIDDIRSTAEYRKTVAANLLRRFLAETA
ncbi:MAG: xanthine dehydrogenase family protein subunit M [Longimicrobiales bacterium]